MDCRTSASSDSLLNERQSRQSPVAIVGYSYRLPGGIRTDDDFWNLLSEREIVQEPITDRYGKGFRPIGGFSGPGRFASPYEGLIRGEEEKLFDRSLFGISQNEMMKMDPQMRMVLSCSWEAFEHAGWGLQSLRNSQTGVFIGAQVSAVTNWRPMRGSSQFDVTNVSLAMLANRVSYHFNLMGPSATYCTACSSSLTALHAAMGALLNGDCEQAVVGSVTYLGTSNQSCSFNALGVISPDGKCHSFDADANGYMRSEGAFVYAIKPLEAAERDGDRVVAIVEATAVNAAGTADGSVSLAQGRYITAPTRHAQVELMKQACKRAGRHPEEFDYIEAHATGTVVGDRIEGNAIAEAYGGVHRDIPLRVSSVKSNLGHMEAAAFHCSLLKVILMMQRRTFAPTSKNYLIPNPEIDFDSCPMQVQEECEAFPERPVLFGINSFGFGGANGHCVVCEPPQINPSLYSQSVAPETGFMIPLSARTPEALSLHAKVLRESLDRHSFDIYDLAGNLSRRRTHFATRTAFSVTGQAELATELDKFIETPEPISTAKEEAHRLAMVFSGQGTQWAGCARELYRTDPVFRRAVDAIEDHWRGHSDVSLRDACFRAPQEDLDEVQLAQPVIFMIQCALVEVLKTWGVHPDCVVGHSSGEVAAAYASGLLSLADATRLVHFRATLQQRRAGSGRMLAIGLDRPQVEDLLRERGISFGFGDEADDASPLVEIACENSPASTVICGTEPNLRPIMNWLDDLGRQNMLLPGNIAFHSTAMNALKVDALDSFGFIDGCQLDPDAHFVSSVTGTTETRLDRAYWWSNMRQPVRFMAAMETLQRDFSPDAILEIAPHCALQPTIMQCLETRSDPPACIPTLMRDCDARRSIHHALGALFRTGFRLDFAAQYPRPKPVFHLLPGHPRNEHVAMDIMIDDEMFVRQGQYSHGPLVGQRIPSPHISFEARLSLDDFPWLGDHRVHHAAIMPAAGYIELIVQALEGAPIYFDELEFLQPCPIPKTAVRLHTTLSPVDAGGDEFTFTITSRPYDIDSESELHCRGKVRLLGDTHEIDVPKSLDLIDTTTFDTSLISDDGDFYQRLEAVLSGTFQYGPHFRTLKRVRQDSVTHSYLCDIEIDEGLWRTGRDEGYYACPPQFDGCLQVFLLQLLAISDLFAFPQRAECVTYLRAPTSHRVTCHITKPPTNWNYANERGQYSVRRGEESGGSIRIYDTQTGDLLAHIGNYVYFTSNPRWNDLPSSRHRIVWHPKFVPSLAEEPCQTIGDDLEPASLVAALAALPPIVRQGCRVIELAGDLKPEQTLLSNRVDDFTGSPINLEYWLVGDDEKLAQEAFEALHHLDITVRFAVVGAAADREPDNGLLRRAAAEIVVVHAKDGSLASSRWKLARRLAVAGGLVLVLHDNDDEIVSDAGWTILGKQGGSTLFQTPCDDTSVEGSDDLARLPVARWVMGEPGSLAADWVGNLDRSADVHQIPEADWCGSRVNAMIDIHGWPEIDNVRAIDFFVGDNPEDPVGVDLVARFIAFVQSLISWREANATDWCQLTVVTRNSVHVPDNPRGGALRGAVRSMAVEIGKDAKIDFRLVDIGSPGDLTTLERLVRCDTREQELAIKDGRVWAPRMIGIRERYASVPARDDCNYRLFLDNPGQVGGLQMKTAATRSPGTQEVEIEVAAAALNFRDIVVTLGLLPALAYERSALGEEVGFDGSGIVRRVGPGVQDLNVGDEVAFNEGGCIGKFVTVNQSRVFAKPCGLSMEEAASTLSVYVTAQYALVHLANLRKGQRVLIHSAMGGVGQAAISIARHVGAEIYATAGSEEKRKALLKLGVKAAFDSHSFDWHDGLMAATGGEGVDVVLNSLAGRHVRLCLQSLKAGGWHCEIGKVDVYADAELGLRVFRKNLRFAAIDIDRLLLDDPQLTKELAVHCFDLIARGDLVPLPMTTFPYAEYASALRKMMTGQHQGKLVLTAPSDLANRNFPIADVRPLFDEDATYLVTGALGGVGLRLLPYMVALGARHLTIIDRRSELGRDAEWIRRSSALHYMDAAVQFDIVEGDVGQKEDVERCISRLSRPLKGVFHLAGVLGDQPLKDLTPDSIARVFASKATGALNLHAATSGLDLDHFVLFSSTSSTLGSPGQVNYAAANSYLDSLAAWRRRQGLPALAFNMAGVTEAGMAARNLGAMRIMRAAGLPPISSEFAISNLDYALRTLSQGDHIVSALFERPAWTVDSTDYMRTGHLIRNRDAFASGESDELTVEAVMAQVAAKVAELCGHEEADHEEPLSSFGLTSISVTELGTFIQSEFNHRVSAIELMTTASAKSLAYGIVHGVDDADQESEESEEITSESAVHAVQPTAVRPQSIFANPWESHFPAMQELTTTPGDTLHE